MKIAAKTSISKHSIKTQLAGGLIMIKIPNKIRATTIPIIKPFNFFITSSYQKTTSITRWQVAPGTGLEPIQ